MKKYKNRQVIGEFRKTFSDLIGRSTIADQAQLEQFLDEQLEKKEEEVKKEFERFRNNLVTEDMNREFEEQLKTKK